MTSRLAFRMNHVSIPVSDVTQSQAFYEKIGLEPGFEKRDDASVSHLLQMACPDGSFVELVKSDHANVIRFGLSPHFGVQTTDIHAAVAELKDKGITPLDAVRRGTSGVDWFFIQDPDGHLIEFTAPVAP